MTFCLIFLDIYVGQFIVLIANSARIQDVFLTPLSPEAYYKFCILCAKKGTNSRKVHHWRW